MQTGLYWYASELEENSVLTVIHLTICICPLICSIQCPRGLKQLIRGARIIPLYSMHFKIWLQFEFEYCHTLYRRNPTVNGYYYDQGIHLGIDFYSSVVYSVANNDDIGNVYQHRIVVYFRFQFSFHLDFCFCSLTFLQKENTCWHIVRDEPILLFLHTFSSVSIGNQFIEF